MNHLTFAEQLLAFYKRLHFRQIKDVVCSTFLLICLGLVIVMIGFMLISGRAVSFPVFTKSAEFPMGDSDVVKAVFFAFSQFQVQVIRVLNISMFFFLAMIALVMLLFFISNHYAAIIIESISQRIRPKSEALSTILLETGKGTGFRLLGMLRFVRPLILGWFVVGSGLLAWKYENDIDSYFVLGYRFVSTSMVILALIFCLFDAYTGRLDQVVNMMKQKKLPKRQRITYFVGGYVRTVAVAALFYIELLLLCLGIEAVGSVGVPNVDNRINQLVDAYAVRLSEAGGYETERVKELLTLALQPYGQGRLWGLELMNHAVLFLGKARILVVPFFAVFGIYYVAIPLYRLEVNRPAGFVLISLCAMVIADFLIETCLPSFLGIISDSVLYKIGWMTITFITLLLADRIGYYYFRK